MIENRRSPYRWGRAFALLAAGFTLVHLSMLGVVPLTGDEAYYWVSSAHLDWSYYDMPGLIIWLVGISTRLFGVSETATRLPAVAVGLAIALALGWISRRLWKDGRAAFWALAGLLASPLFALGSMYISTDIVLCLFALVVPAVAAIAVLERRPHLWLLVGALGGLGGNAKFSAVLYVPVVLAVALLGAGGRAQLRRPEPWLGALLGFAALSPALIWGARHGFDNLSFQLVDRQHHIGWTIRWFTDYLGAQFLLASPLLFVLLVTGLIVETHRAWRESDLATLALALTADTYLVFFGLVGLFRFSAPHWSAPAYAPGALVVSRWVLRRWPAWTSRRRRWIASALAVGLLLAGAAHSLLCLIDRIPRGLAYSPERNRLSTDSLDLAYGWPELVAHLRSLEGAAFDPARDPIVCDSYSTASLIAFYSKKRYDPLLLATARGIHGLSYLYWQSAREYAGRPGLYVGDWDREATRTTFTSCFGSTTDLGIFTISVPGRGGSPSRTVQRWRIIRGESLTADVDSLVPFTPAGRARPAARTRPHEATRTGDPRSP